MGGKQSVNTSRVLVHEYNKTLDDITTSCWSTLDTTTTWYDRMDQTKPSRYQSQIESGKLMRMDYDCLKRVVSNSRSRRITTDAAENAARVLSRMYKLDSVETEGCRKAVAAVFKSATAAYVEAMGAVLRGPTVVSLATISNADASVLGAYVTTIPYTSSMLFVHDRTERSVLDSIQMKTLYDVILPHTSTTARMGASVIILLISTIAVLLITTIGIVNKMTKTPLFWFLLSSVGLATSAYFMLAYQVGWWPYGSGPVKSQTDHALMACSSIAFGMFTLADLTLFADVVSSKVRAIKSVATTTTATTASTNVKDDTTTTTI